MNTETILHQFHIIEESMIRAKLPLETNMMQPEIIEVSLWELIKSMKQIENIIREISPERFGPRMVERYTEPEITIDQLFVCPYCGSLDCQSDHK